MDVATVIAAHDGSLTPAERKAAEVILAQPELTAFGTVADVAERAGVSGATVVRLSIKLGLEGFVELQQLAQADLSRRLRPATEKIRQPDRGDVLGRALRVALDDVHATFAAVDQTSVAALVAVLAARGRKVFVLCGDASSGVGRQFAMELAMLRDGVIHLDGGASAVGRQSASMTDGDVLVVLDLRRYDRLVVDTARVAATAGAKVFAFTDSALSPLASIAESVFIVAAGGTGAFDSYVGALALFDGVLALVADRLRSSATERLDRVESAWRKIDALTDS